MLFIVNTSIRKIKKIPTWSLVIINQLIHDLTIVIQCGGAAAVQVVSVLTDIAVEDINNIPVVQACLTASVGDKKHLNDRIHHSYSTSRLIFCRF